MWWLLVNEKKYYTKVSDKSWKLLFGLPKAKGGVYNNSEIIWIDEQILGLVCLLEDTSQSLISVKIVANMWMDIRLGYCVHGDHIWIMVDFGVRWEEGRLKLSKQVHSNLKSFFLNHFYHFGGKKYATVKLLLTDIFFCSKVWRRGWHCQRGSAQQLGMSRMC